MPHNQVRLLLSDVDGHSEWFRFRNINKWIQKLLKPSIIGMYVGKYEGEWKDGQMHGTGTLSISRIKRGYLGFANPFGWKLIDEGEYVGEWKNAKKNGQGTYTWFDGDQYVGEWKEGKPNGQGTLTFPDGSKYEGEYKNGKCHGQGTLTFSDGSKYEGEWKEGEKTLDPRERLKILTKREEKILRLRKADIDSSEVLTQAEALIEQENVGLFLARRELEAKALRKLRYPSRSIFFKSFSDKEEELTNAYKTLEQLAKFKLE